MSSGTILRKRAAPENTNTTNFSNIQKSPLLLNYKYALLSYTLMVIGLVIFGGLIVLTQGSAVGPHIYTIF